MMTIFKPKEYRLLDLHPQNRSPLRLLIYHKACKTYKSLLAEQIPLKDITGQALDQEELDRVDVLLIWKCPDSVLNSLTNLKWIQTTSAGIDQILHYMRAKPELVVTTTKGMGAEPVSQYILTMMLALQWDLPGLLELQRTHTWKMEAVGLMSQATCAIVGLGNIGRKVASYAKHLGMTVVGTKRQPKPVENVDELYQLDQLHKMLEVADFVILSLPLTEKTRGMFSEAEFRAMKPSAFLIQAARHGIVDEGALLDALTNGEIAGAAVDVFEQEPLPPDHPLWDAPNIIITPHQAGERADYLESVAKIFIRNIMEYPNLDRMEGLASADAGY